jgi:hypothetical protein
VQENKKLNHRSKVQTQNRFASFLCFLGWRNPKKRKSKIYDFHIHISSLDSTELSILTILKEFIVEIIQNDLRNARYKNIFLIEIQKYIRFSNKKSNKAFNTALAYVLRFFVFGSSMSLLALKFFPLSISKFKYFFILSLFMTLIILFIFSLRSFLLVCVGFFWSNRSGSYNKVSSIFQRSVKNKVLLNIYVEKICEYPKDKIQDIEKNIGSELKKIEREFDSNLELAPILAAIIVVAFTMNTDFKNFILGIAGLSSLVIAFLRLLNRRNKNFQIDCLEQILLLLQLAQNKLDSKDL